MASSLCESPTTPWPIPSFKSFFPLCLPWPLRNHLTPLLRPKVFLPHTPPQMPPHPSSPYGLRPPKSATTPMKPGSPALQAPPMSGVSDSRTRTQQLLRPHHKTSPLIWCGAVMCVVFSLLLILAGVITLIIFLVVKPRNPSLDLTAASLNTIYIDSSTYLNSDFTFLANFSNPNHKIDFTFEYLGVELYFHDRIIAVQAVQPFAQRTGESRLESVHMVSSEVPLPPGLALQLQQQVRGNSVVYSVRGTFKVKASLGAGHLSYWIYPRCDVELSAPPNGVLVAKRCRAKS